MSAPERPPLPPRTFSNPSLVSFSRRTTSINSAISKSIKLISRVKKRLPNSKPSNPETPLMERSTTTDGTPASFDSQTASSSSATFVFPTPDPSTYVGPTTDTGRPLTNPVCHGLPVTHRLGNNDFCSPADLRKLIDTGSLANRNVVLQRVIDGYTRCIIKVYLRPFFLNEFSTLLNFNLILFCALGFITTSTV